MEKFTRPKAAVLPRAALVPSTNQIPRPSRFTHRLKTEQEFHLDNAKGTKPAGKLARGTKVLLIERGDTRCRVADRKGLCVEVDCDSLVKLSAKEKAPRAGATRQRKPR